MVECNAVCELYDDNLLTKYLIKKFEGIDIDITNGLVEIYAKTNIKKVTDSSPFFMAIFVSMVYN